MKKLKRILLIDDSEAINHFNKSFFTELGIAEKIDFCSSSQSALDYLKGINQEDQLPPKPELILLDIEMPGMDGFDFLEAYIKLDPSFTNDFNLVISLVSNHLDIDNFTKSKDYKSFGVLDHIKKPIDKEDIENLFDENFN